MTSSSVEDISMTPDEVTRRSTSFPFSSFSPSSAMSIADPPAPALDCEDLFVAAAEVPPSCATPKCACVVLAAICVPIPVLTRSEASPRPKFVVVVVVLPLA